MLVSEEIEVNEQDAALPQELQYVFGEGDGFRPRYRRYRRRRFPLRTFLRLFLYLLLSLLLS